jgi:orotidine-5'-phosphate decarboxylase
MNAESPLILAVDSTEIDRARELIDATSDSIGLYKFGLEFYLRNGLNSIHDLKRDYPGLRIFLDLKLHDIPNTVKGAAQAVQSIAPEILTVHASGGSEMIKSAVSALPDTLIAAVTVLTSLGRDELISLGLPANPEALTISLAKRAQDSGARALVSSPLELSGLRRAFPDLKLITPGIREAGAPLDDQSRTMTASEAMSAGADYLVIGRPITRAVDPRRAAAAIYDSLG